MTVRKRDGSYEEFDVNKIINAVDKAFKAVGNYPEIREEVLAEIKDEHWELYTSIEDIQDWVEKTLMGLRFFEEAKAYIIYRESHRAQRDAINALDEEISGITNGTNIEAIRENSNKDAQLNSTQRDLMLGTYSRGYAVRHLMSERLSKAHEEGLIHFHDLDYAISHRMGNCCLINLEDILQNGTVINGKRINKPHGILTAATIASQVVLQVSNNQFGGCTINVAHLAPFVRDTRVKYYTKWGDTVHNEDTLKALVEGQVRYEVDSAMQTLQYQLNTFSSTNGQSPFVSVFMYLDDNPEYKEETAMLIESILRQRLEGMQNANGVWTTPAFPKLLFVLDTDNMHPGAPYYYLKQLAMKCSAKRMNPDYMSAKKLKEYYEGNVFACMGCRSMLSPWKDSEGNYKFWGRFNRGVVTVNLPDAALTAVRENRDFIDVLDERLELCKEAMETKTKWILGTTTYNSPIHYQFGACLRLPEGSTIDEYILNGYSTVSLGYIGLDETVKILTGKALKKSLPLAASIMQHLLDKVNYWKKNEKYLAGCGLYGTPSESLCYRFAKTIKSRFGEVPAITDKMWITNSYHVNVEEKVDAFEKLEVESMLQKYSLGGAISYVEIPNMTNNILALEKIVDYLYENFTYAEINTRAGDYCATCGFEGEITTNKDLEWQCPQCGEKDKNKLTIVRRSCGYIGSNFWNKGKTEEISKRVLHTEVEYEIPHN